MSMDDKEARTEYVVQELDKQNEAKGHAVAARNEAKQQGMTPEERRRQIDADNEALFGPEI